VTARGSAEVSAPSDTRIVFLAPKDVLVARVARKCMMQLCEALTSLGVDLELISLRIRTVESEPTRTRSVWDVYGIEHRFRLTMVPTCLRQEKMDGRLGRFAILLYRLFIYPMFAFRAYRRVGSGGTRPPRTVFYSRNYGCIVGILLLRKLLGNRARAVLELHLPPQGRLQRTVIRLADGVACNSLALHEVMVERGLLHDGNSMGRHAGFSPYLTECTRLSREEARRKLGWATSDRIACYTGKVVWRMGEIELIVRAAEQLADQRTRVVIVGGRADQVVLWREEVARRDLGNVEFVGFVAPSDALLYQMAADVLLLYYPTGLPLNDYRSPGKLFEYMASGTPAVVSDYLSIREVMRDGENGLLVPPNRPDMLAAAVTRILNDANLASRLAEQARADAMLFTWTATARSTLSLVDRLWSE
jgi:glycosyltransferase involved in cell wall biosynthesis